MNRIETFLFWFKVKAIWRVAYRWRRLWAWISRRREPESTAYDFDHAKSYWKNVPRAKGGFVFNTEDLAKVSDGKLVELFDREIMMARGKKERKAGFDLAYGSVASTEVPNVMDYGSGIGFYGFEILFRHFRAKVTFVDISEANLEIIRRVANRKGLISRVSCMAVCDPEARDLDFEKPFDLITSMSVLHHTPYAPGIVQHLTQFLKREGIFQVMLYNRTYLKAMETVVGRSLDTVGFGKMTGSGVGPYLNPYSDAYDDEKAIHLFSDYALIDSYYPDPFYNIYRFRKRT